MNKASSRALRDVYYQLKPILPWSIRLSVRRARAKRLRDACGQTWPISPSSAKTPRNWPGWPDGKQFAVILTHDVEGAAGISRCAPLLNLEKELGFRSCYNFVPEGTCSVPPELRKEIIRHGNEVGVHDLRHDGKLYRFRRSFQTHARQINHYLKEWNAVGFRSAFMLHEPNWLHDLNILYDASTFDTDPFEPQPEGVDTIFPFWVAGAHDRGYVELPYTLVQDFTLFVILQEPGPEIWKRKLDWIAKNRGMALMDTHPDYMAFSNEKLGSKTYPVAYYREFLEYVQTKYKDMFWQPLPREVAAFVRDFASTKTMTPSVDSASPVSEVKPRKGAKIWIDLDNTPHVPFFLPIIAELRERGYEVSVTARDAFQVCQLADFHRLAYRRIGRHYGKNKLIKLFGLLFRGCQCLPYALKEKPDLGLSHGSRAQMVACNLLQIPSILIADYEHAQTPPLMRPKWELAPETIPDGVLHCRNGNIRKYPGLKEDVYAWTLVPDSSVLKELGIEANQILALVRPPATEAHYHNPESEILFESAMTRLGSTPNTRVVLLPRNRRQEEWIRGKWPKWFQDGRVVVPARALNGLNLVWHADLVISGGGTMNREAAALGVPVYSIFRGKLGAVDQNLHETNRLVLLRSVAEVNEKIAVQKRAQRGAPNSNSRVTLARIVSHIEEIMALEMCGRRRVNL